MSEEEDQSSLENNIYQNTDGQGSSVKSENVEIFPDYPRPPDYDSWIPAKKSSWDQLHVNPSAFFYRHRLPDEEKRNGPWSEEEKMFFIQKLREKPALLKDWGGFARSIPGRVGYQCNAFFRKLVATGEIQRLAPDIVIPASVIANVTEKEPKTHKKKVDAIASDAKLEEESENNVVLPKLIPSLTKEIPPESKESILKNAKLFF